MGEKPLELSRQQILAYRRRVGHLDSRMPAGSESLRQAAAAGLTDSGPRAAVLSLHARVERVEPSTWEDPSLVQVWGPRFSAYVVAKTDRAIFTLGRMPRSGQRRARAEEIAAKLAAFLGAEQMTYRAAGEALGVDPNALRYGTLTGTVLLRWEGSGKPTIRMVERPAIGEAEARRELVRRFLHTFGTGTADSFAQWAGVSPAQARLTFAELAPDLIPARTPFGDALILADAAELLLGPQQPPAPARLLPSGDPYYLLQGRDREVLLEDANRRAGLWTTRVWPGAVLIEGEVAGTWRRSKGNVSVFAWRQLSKFERAAVEAEATSFPLAEQPITVSWSG